DHRRQARRQTARTPHRHGRGAIDQRECGHAGYTEVDQVELVHKATRRPAGMDSGFFVKLCASLRTSFVMTSQAPALEMRGITKSFAGNTVLADVSLCAKAGEVHALVGENGAGKSTLMKILAGVHQPDGGEIAIEGNLVRFARPADALAHGIAMIYQELSLAPHLTVAENIFLGREPLRSTPLKIINRREMNVRAAALLADNGFGLDPLRRGSQLSAADSQL